MGILKENKIYEIRQSSIHNRGAFAVQDIPEGTRVIEYIGDKITKAESEKRSIRMIEKAKKTDRGAVYIFELNKRHDIDGSVNYNIARFINHSCDPNCETDIIRGRIWIIALRDIKKAEELLNASGAIHVTNNPLLRVAGWHLMGTARMGLDPSKSVVNEKGQAHDVKNLFIVDGSVFVTGAAVNPTSTIQAVALYIADHIKKEIAHSF